MSYIKQSCDNPKPETRNDGYTMPKPASRPPKGGQK